MMRLVTVGEKMSVKTSRLKIYQERICGVVKSLSMIRDSKEEFDLELYLWKKICPYRFPKFSERNPVLRRQSCN